MPRDGIDRQHLGVYAVGRPPETPLGRAAAAVLACGPDAALCGASAFSVWEFDNQWVFPAHLCAPTNRARPGIVTHKFPSLARRDVRTHQGIRVTSPARRQFKDAFPDWCEQHGLPAPQINATVNGHEVDAYFPDHQLIVELDGWNYHQDRHNFETDRDRDAHQLAHGLPTVRITWQRITQTPTNEARRLQQILDRLSKR